MTTAVLSRPIATGLGLDIRPWDEDLVAQMARWGRHEFPYSPFNLDGLADPEAAAARLKAVRESTTHHHYIACEGSSPVGRMAVNGWDSLGLYLWGVHVPPEYEGRGVCRRMLAVVMTHLEGSFPRNADFVLTSHAFAHHAHRAYEALGFRAVETRWARDAALSTELLKLAPPERAPWDKYLRFNGGTWEVRSYLFRRKRGAPMATSHRP